MAGWRASGGVRWCSEQSGQSGQPSPESVSRTAAPGDDVQDDQAERHLGDAEKAPGSDVGEHRTNRTGGHLAFRRRLSFRSRLCRPSCPKAGGPRVLLCRGGGPRP